MLPCRSGVAFIGPLHGYAYLFLTSSANYSICNHVYLSATGKRCNDSRLFIFYGK